MFETDETSIINLLNERVVDTLSVEMSDLVTDETAAGLVRSGRLQDDPTIAQLNILIREGGESFPDILVPKNYNLVTPQYDLTMSQYWLRRMVAEYTLFFIGDVSRTTARSRANVIFSRFKKKLMQLDVQDLTDSFGETAIMPQVLRLDTTEGGGPGTFIWRGTHYFEFLTETVEA